MKEWKKLVVINSGYLTNWLMLNKVLIVLVLWSGLVLSGLVYYMEYSLHLEESNEILINEVNDLYCNPDTIVIKKEKQVKTVSISYSSFDEGCNYWKSTAKAFGKQYNLPYKFILAKMWQETKMGKTGIGRKGSYFGIKGKGHKGYDNVDKMKVSYEAYNENWKAFSHFCKLVNKPLYKNRYLAWKKVHPNKPDYVLWSLALQVHPQLDKSYLSYAMNGAFYTKNKPSGEEDLKIYYKRKEIAKRTIKIASNIKF